MIDVITVWAPRPNDRAIRSATLAVEKYLLLMDLQRRTCERFGHRHRVVSDADVPGFDVIKVAFPAKFSFAMVAGQIAALEQWDNQDHLVLADCDVAIARDLAGAFGDGFDIGLTSRIEPTSPVNNGVMYVSAGARKAALGFFRAAYELCQGHWGGDQEAISKAAAPVKEKGDWIRQGARIRFLPCKRYNMTPGVNGIAGQGNPFAVHFKGKRKHQMQPFVDTFVLR